MVRWYFSLFCVLCLAFCACGSGGGSSDGAAEEVVIAGPDYSVIVPGFEGDSEDVAPDAVIVISFNRDMDASTLTADTVSVQGAQGRVSGSLSYDEATRRLSFTAASRYAYEGEYRLLVSNGIKDSSGDIMTQSVDFTFKIRADNDPPRSVSRVPVADAVNVSVQAPVSITFDEPVDSA